LVIYAQDIIRYWDFNKDSSLPKVVQHEGLDIIVPGDSEGEKKNLHLEHNPFYSYKFTSYYAWGIVADRLGWDASVRNMFLLKTRYC
jgi:hypothetical protein